MSARASGHRWLAAGALVSLLFLGACAQVPTATVEALPELELPRQDAMVMVSKLDVLAMLRAATPAGAEFKLEDDRYFLVTRPWVEAVHRWFVRFLGLQIGPERVPDFLRERPRKVALLLESLAELDVQRNHAIKGQALVGMLEVQCDALASQVPIDWDKCFFVVFGTRDGFQVLDPVSGRVYDVREFPMWEHAVRVSF